MLCYVCSDNGSLLAYGKSMQGKAMTNNLLFTAEKTSSLQLKTQPYVFLATNVTKETCDFRIKGCFNKKTSKVYKEILPTLWQK